MSTTLRKDYFWNSFGSLLQSAISPLLLVVVTRINGMHDSGLFSYAFAVSMVFWAFGTWGGRTYQISDVKNEFTQNSYVTVRIVLGVAMLVGALLFSIVNSYDIAKTLLICVFVLFKALESIADAIYGILQVNNRLYVVGKSLVYKTLFSSIVFLLIDIATSDILLSALGIVLVNVIIIFVYDLPNARHFEDISALSKNFNKYLREALLITKRCAPVFAVWFLTIFTLNIPRYYLDKYHPEDIGYYGIIAMPITLIILLMSLILQPNMVDLSKLYDQRRYSSFNRTVLKLMLATTLLGVITLLLAYFVGAQALELVFGVSFEEYNNELLIMVVGGILNALTVVFIILLIVMRRFRAQFYILLVSNVLLLIASALLVRPNGIIASTVLFACVSMVQLVLLIAAYCLALVDAKNSDI